MKRKAKDRDVEKEIESQALRFMAHTYTLDASAFLLDMLESIEQPLA
jgi:hypothetical protein